MKKNLKIIFLLLAVVGILVIALLLIFCNVSLADVSLDTFIGVMVTMVGILVTFAVGWQIINALEIKNKLAEMEKLKVEINSQREKIEKISARSRYDIALNRSYTLYKSGECIKAFACVRTQSIAATHLHRSRVFSLVCKPESVLYAQACKW